MEGKKKERLRKVKKGKATNGKGRKWRMMDNNKTGKGSKKGEAKEGKGEKRKRNRNELINEGRSKTK